MSDQAQNQEPDDPEEPAPWFLRPTLWLLDKRAESATWRSDIHHYNYDMLLVYAAYKQRRRLCFYIAWLNILLHPVYRVLWLVGALALGALNLGLVLVLVTGETLRVWAMIGLGGPIDPLVIKPHVWKHQVTQWAKRRKQRNRNKH